MVLLGHCSSEQVYKLCRCMVFFAIAVIICSPSTAIQHFGARHQNARQTASTHYNHNQKNNVDGDRSRTSSFPSKHWVISCILAHVTITASINLDVWNAFRHTIETTAHGTPHSHSKHLVMVCGEGFPRLLRHQHPFDRKNCFTSNSLISIEFP